MNKPHTHGHRHSVDHPHAYGRQISVAHDHEHTHTSKRERAWREHDPFHRNHAHTDEQKADMHRQQLGEKNADSK